jgi:hypothetical protein
MIAIPQNIPAGAALSAGQLVTVDAGTWIVATDSTSPVFVCTSDTASGAYPDIAGVGEFVEIRTDGNVTAEALITATTGGVGTPLVPTGAAAAWTAGFVFAADIGARVRMLVLPQYHAADAA